MGDKMKLPTISGKDLMLTLPVGFCSAAAHSAGVFCLGADPLFGQIVKAGEPVLSALVNTVFYGKAPSFAKFLCLFPIVGGVAFASLKKIEGKYALKFDQTALVFGLIGNSFQAKACARAAAHRCGSCRAACGPRPVVGASLSSIATLQCKARCEVLHAKPGQYLFRCKRVVETWSLITSTNSCACRYS